MRYSAMMAIGAIAAVGGALAVPALSDGPAHYRNAADHNRTQNTPLITESLVDAIRGQTETPYEGDGGTLSSGDRVYGYESGLPATPREETARMAPSVGEESIAVQARRLPDGARVALRGMVRDISGKTLVVQRGNHSIHARLPGAIPQIRGGDNVTVYGRIANRAGDISVRADAVLLMAGAGEGHLLLAPSRLESVNKRNPPVTRSAARDALDYYRYNFAPL